jgi:hypothetical protein
MPRKVHMARMRCSFLCPSRALAIKSLPRTLPPQGPGAPARDPVRLGRTGLRRRPAPAPRPALRARHASLSAGGPGVLGRLPRRPGQQQVSLRLEDRSQGAERRPGLWRQSSPPRPEGTRAAGRRHCPALPPGQTPGLPAATKDGLGLHGAGACQSAVGASSPVDRCPQSLPQTAAAAAPDGLLTSIPPGQPRLPASTVTKETPHARSSLPAPARLGRGGIRPNEGPGGGASGGVPAPRSGSAPTPPPANESAHRAVGRDGAMERLANRTRRSPRGDARKGARAMLRGVGWRHGVGARRWWADGKAPAGCARGGAAASSQ